MSESNWRPRFGTTQGQVWYWRYGSGILLRQAARHLDENRHCIAGRVLGWLCYSIASNMPGNDRLGSKAVRRRREKDDVGFRQIGKEAIRFTRPPIDLSHRPRDGSVVSFLHCMNDPQPEGHMASYIGRRKFLATLGGAAAAWPLAARAQQAERMRRVGVLMTMKADMASGMNTIEHFDSTATGNVSINGGPF